MLPLMLLSEPIDVTIKYDFSIWDTFLKNIISSVRSIADNGIWIFAFVSVLLILISLINYFSNVAFSVNTHNKNSASNQLFSSEISKTGGYFSGNNSHYKSSSFFDNHSDQSSHSETQNLRKAQAKLYYESRKSKGQIK